MKTSLSPCLSVPVCPFLWPLGVLRGVYCAHGHTQASPRRDPLATDGPTAPGPPPRPGGPGDTQLWAFQVAVPRVLASLGLTTGPGSWASPPPPRLFLLTVPQDTVRGGVGDDVTFGGGPFVWDSCGIAV